MSKYGQRGVVVRLLGAEGVPKAGIFRRMKHVCLWCTLITQL